MDVVAGALTLLAAAGGIVAAVRHGRRRRERWRRAAEACGITDLYDASDWVHSRVAGRNGNATVTIGTYSHGKHDHGSFVSLTSPECATGELKLHAENLDTTVRKMFGAQEIHTGDGEFDDLFFVRGTKAFVHALLGADARRRLRKLREHGRLDIACGLVRVNMNTRHFDAHMIEVLTHLVELGRAFARHSNIVDALGDNVRRDPLPSVRLQNLRALTAEFGQVAEIEETLEAACRDASPDVRLHAALASGPEGHDTLRRLTEENAPDEIAAKAVDGLGTALPVDRTCSLLDDAVVSSRSRTARSCIVRLTGFGEPRVVQSLKGALMSTDVEVAAAAAEALGKTPRAEVAAALLAALAREEDQVRIAAASALGAGGSVDAVLQLKEAAERHGGRAFERAVREAVAAIQARLSGASPGQLSIASAEAGGVSIVTGEGGELSMPGADGGRLGLDEERRDD